MRFNSTIFFLSFILLIGYNASCQTYLNGEAKLIVSSLEAYKQKITFECPTEWEGFNVHYQIGNEYVGEQKIISNSDNSLIEFLVDATRDEIDGKPFSLTINNFPLVTIHSIYEYISATHNVRNSAMTDLIQIKLFAAEVGAENDWELFISVIQKEGMMPLLQKLSESNLKYGTIHLMIASHQDTGWEDTPAQCEENRDIKIISPALELLKENPDYYFNVENMLSLMEYIKRNPQKKDLIYQLTKDGRLSWGAMYNQPYEEMYSGESLVREFYFGRKWFKENFPGLDTRTVWNVDVPGRTLQAAQLMAKAGVKYLIISRQQQGIFEWQSPDGSKVKVYSPGDYGETWRQFQPQRSHFRTFRHLADYALEYQSYNINARENAVIPFMVNKDMSPPFLYKNIIEKWNKLDYWEAMKGEKVILTLPKIEYSTPERFFEKLEKINNKLPVIQGECPNVWVYIHGPSHHNMLSASREGGMLLTAAEKFATFNVLLKNNWSEYPKSELNQAWQDHLYPDHGMGGKNGHITDQLFLDKSLNAVHIADSILKESLISISSKIDFENKNGIPLIVFNSMSLERTNHVKVSLNISGKNFRNFELIDHSGKKTASQILNCERDNKGNISQVEIVFLAEKVPSLGYKTYWIKQSKNLSSFQNKKSGIITFLENDYYQLELGKGGISQIKDKELDINLFSTEKFKAGELFSMHSEGTGAGEFAQIQQPDMEGFEKMTYYEPVWQNYTSGDIYQSVELVQKIKNALVTQKIILYNHIKKIEFQTSLLNWDGTQFREFRLAFPVNLDGGQVAYEVPFGKVEVGKDEILGAPGERYLVNASEIRPRGIQNWISVRNKQAEIVLSSPIAVWDYLDPTEAPLDYPVLQPVLLASRRSCHHLGNWYLQEGDHHYTFSITSHSATSKISFQSALEHNEPLIPVFNPIITDVNTKRKIPAELSFVNIDKPNVIISTIKKCETENKIVLRLYETIGEKTNIKLNTYFPVANVEKCDLIEEEQGLTYDKSNIEVGKYSIETFKIN